MARPKKLNLGLLASIVAAGQASPPTLVYLTPAEAKPLIDFKPKDATAPTPLVEQNPQMPDPNDPTKFATRATADGVAYSKANPSKPVTEPKPRGPAPTFEMEFGNFIPIAKRGSAETIYPFATMVAPDFTNPAEPKFHQFFVPATERQPNPAKSLQSTVSSATRRYTSEQKDAQGNVVKDGAGNPVKVQERKYVVRAETRWFDANGARVAPGTAGATENKGALIIREK